MIRYIYSTSWGKDSALGLIECLRRGLPLNEVVFFDTGDEFDCIYIIMDAFRPILESKGIKLTVVTADETFDELFSEHMISKRSGEVQEGYSWCGGKCRWLTTYKIQCINKYYKESYPDDVIVEYIAYAADECHRIDRTRKGDTVQIYPLVEWGITESQCLDMCRKYGLRWEQEGIDLYEILTRVSCKKCGNKGIGELRNLYRNCPSYWRELEDYQRKTSIPYKGVGVFALAERFQEELEKELAGRSNMQVDLFDFAKEYAG